MAIKSSFGNRFGSVFGSRFFNAFEAASPPSLVLDPDAANYIDAVETADGQSLELAVKVAYNNFILGCKSDGIWTAIKSSCILVGARTLNGALVPLVGTAPTNYNFVAGDYNRETGLKGDGSTKYLNSNRSGSADPQNDMHIGVYVNTLPTNYSALISGWGSTISGSPAATSTLQWTGSQVGVNNKNSISQVFSRSSTPGYFGTSRNNSSNYIIRKDTNTTSSTASVSTPDTTNFLVYRRGLGSSPRYSTAEISFYSIGTFLDLTLLNSRLFTLMTDIGNAIS